LRVGFTLDFRNAPRRRRPWRDFWEDGLWLLGEAEALGFDSLHVQEHFFQPDGYAPSMPAFLALLAERTRRARLGSYVYVLPLHHPAALAQETAVLDHLSGGRLDVGVGLGHSLAEYVAFGVDRSARGARMEEALEVLRLAWTRRPFSFSGRFFCLREVEVRPEPLQQPHPPLWVAATTPAAAARAGRCGAFLAAGSVEPEVFDAYRSAWVASGRPLEQSRSSTTLTITATPEDPEKVWARNRELYFDRWDFYSRIRSELGDPALAVALQPSAAKERPPAPTPETYRANEWIADPDTILGKLEPLVRRLGADELVLNGPASGIDWRREGYESVRLFAERVLPVVARW
jgi:alkanesulfonate monooxygenase SsuD/methylene tetrahydromethanopterin reductase-like flavin-dependent oxidoreductase (luciferase family)